MMAAKAYLVWQDKLLTCWSPKGQKFYELRLDKIPETKYVNDLPDDIIFFSLEAIDGEHVKYQKGNPGRTGHG